jgi:hypothetical protein
MFRYRRVFAPELEKRVRMTTHLLSEPVKTGFSRASRALRGVFVTKNS